MSFRVGISADFMRPDGTSAFPDWDMSPLDRDGRIDWAFVPIRDGAIRAADMEGFDALILLSARFDLDSVPADGRLGIVARFGVGYDNVDVAACTVRNIAVVITPDGVRRPVAVAILTHLLALAGRLFAKNRITREGPAGWAKKAGLMGLGLEGRVLGSLGMGNIAGEMFSLARVFGLEFIASDPFADPHRASELDVRLVDLDTLFAESDFLTVNCPYSNDTHRLVDTKRLAQMKPTAFVINTARGPIIDQAALIEALKAGAIAGAGLDVFEEEPLPNDDPLTGMENVILTPHALSWTDQCFAGIGAADIAAVIAVMEGREPRGLLNPTIRSSPLWQERLKANATRTGQ